MPKKRVEYDPYAEPHGEIPGPIPIEAEYIKTDATLPSNLSDHLNADNPNIRKHLENGYHVGVGMDRAGRARIVLSKNPDLIKRTVVTVGIAAIGVGAVAAGIIFLHDQKPKEES